MFIGSVNELASTGINSTTTTTKPGGKQPSPVLKEKNEKALYSSFKLDIFTLEHENGLQTILAQESFTTAHVLISKN